MVLSYWPVSPFNSSATQSYWAAIFPPKATTIVSFVCLDFYLNPSSMGLGQGRGGGEAVRGMGKREWGIEYFN